MDTPSGYFRTSIKGLVLNEENKFLLCREDNGFWDLPGGAMDFSETYSQTLAREIMEEMGLSVVSIGERPLYFMTFVTKNGVWSSNIVFEVKVKDLLYTPSSECEEIRFFDKVSALAVNIYPNLKGFVEKFDPSRH